MQVSTFAPIPTDLEDEYSTKVFTYRQSMFTKKAPYHLYPPSEMSLQNLQAALLNSSGTGQYVESYRSDDIVKFFCDFEAYMPPTTTEEEMTAIRETEFFPALLSAFKKLVGEEFSLDQINWADSSGLVQHKGAPHMKVGSHEYMMCKLYCSRAGIYLTSVCCTNTLPGVIQRLGRLRGGLQSFRHQHFHGARSFWGPRLAI